MLSFSTSVYSTSAYSTLEVLISFKLQLDANLVFWVFLSNRRLTFLKRLIFGEASNTKPVFSVSFYLPVLLISIDFFKVLLFFFFRRHTAMTLAKVGRCDIREVWLGI